MLPLLFLFFLILFSLYYFSYEMQPTWVGMCYCKEGGVGGRRRLARKSDLHALSLSESSH